jgi:hypothetical protein
MTDQGAKPGSDEIYHRFLGKLLGETVAVEVMQAFGEDVDMSVRIESAIKAALAAPKLEVQLKRQHTLNISRAGRLRADFAFVGLDEEASNLPFADLFDTVLANRLGRRLEGFRKLFDELLRSDSRRPFIFETGCLRLPGNWSGDGQSTFMFDAYVRSMNGLCITVDINFESVASARRACSSYTSVVLNDSVSFLHSLGRLGIDRKIDLLYLDSFDLDKTAPMPAAIHHIKELLAAWPMLGPGSIICVDDFSIGESGGKGGIIDDFFKNVAVKTLFSDYQKAWIIE